VTSDSERQHRQAKAMQERIAAQDAADAPQAAQDERARGRSVWDEGPARTPAQVERDAIKARNAQVRRSMAADYRRGGGTWSTDLDDTPGVIRYA
jgi:hypothetical protein